MHAQAVESLPEAMVAGGCDLDEAVSREFAKRFPGVRTGVDLDALLAELQPEIVIIAAITASHIGIFDRVMARGDKVRGIFVEKPMAVHLGDARRMVDACEARGIALVVNHQRRREAGYLTMRRLMDEGRIGRISMIRATCAGDFMSDGTHLIDTTRFLLHDVPAEWIIGQVFRDPAGAPLGYDDEVFTGERFGHVVESGAFAIAQFEGGVQVEYRTGKLMKPRSSYHDIEVVGQEGSLHACDGHLPVDLDYRTKDGPWTPVPLDPWPEPELGRFGLGHAQNLRLMIEGFEDGREHPMSGCQGLRDHELVTAVYESARLHKRVSASDLPSRFPLEAMIEQGIF